MGQNTRTKSLNDLPSIPVISEMAIFWLHCCIIGILAKFDKTTFSTKSCTPSSGFQKCHGQNDRRKRGNISCGWSRTRFAMEKTNQICIFEGGSPYFSIYCLINSFFHEQLLRQSVLIFSYMQALGSRGISQFLFHEITKSRDAHQTIRLDESI